MGCYINPKEQTKEDWLEANATIITERIARELFKTCPDSLPIVLVDNGPFTAAAVAYSPNELEAFLNPNDKRPKKIFLAMIEDLKKVSPIEDYLKS